MHTSEEETKAEPDSNPNANLTLPVKRNDNFHMTFTVCMKVSFWVSLR